MEAYNSTKVIRDDEHYGDYIAEVYHPNIDDWIEYIFDAVQLQSEFGAMWGKFGTKPHRDYDYIAKPGDMVVHYKDGRRTIERKEDLIKKGYC